jgi:hypothetical protein
MPNYTINIDLCVGKRQSPICTGYSVTLVLACSATLVGRLSDTEHWHSFYNPLFQLVTKGAELPYLSCQAILGHETKWADFLNSKDKGVASSEFNLW